MPVITDCTSGRRIGQTVTSNRKNILCPPYLPIYFQNQDQITGLIFLLNLALRMFTLMSLWYSKNSNRLNNLWLVFMMATQNVKLLVDMLNKCFRFFVVLLSTFSRILASSSHLLTIFKNRFFH